MIEQGSLVEEPSWGRRLVGIEGLRGIAAALVIVTHVYQLLPATHAPGWLAHVAYLGGQGLTLFFALSGFLLFRPFVSSILSGSPTPPLARYFLNRVLRIVPAYVVILLLVSLVLGVAYLRAPVLGDTLLAHGQPIGYLTNPLLLLANLFTVQTLFPAGVTTGLSVAWSLSVEIAFYVVMPLLALIAYKLMQKTRANRIVLAASPIAVLIIVGAAGQVWLSSRIGGSSGSELRWLEWGGSWTAVLARSFLVNAGLFASGMTAALVLCLVRNGTIRPSNVQRWRWGGIILGIVAAVVAVRLGSIDDGVSVFSGAVILFVTTSGHTGRLGGLARALDSRPLRYAGLISYSAYLWHIPVTLLLHRFGIVFPSTVLGWVGDVVLVLVVTGVFSFVTYRLVERPSLRLKKRTDVRQPLVQAPDPAV